MRRIAVAALFVTSWLAAAEARQQEAAVPPAWVAAHRVPEGRSLLLFYNASGRTLFGSAYTVRVDGRKVARLARGEYTAVVLEPGLHDARVGSFKKVPFATAADRLAHWAVAYSPSAAWGAPFTGGGFGYGVIPDSLGTRLAAAFRWVDPLAALPADRDSNSAGAAAH